MNCPIESRNPELLVAHVAGTLDGAAQQAMDGHMSGCEACRRAAAEQAVVWEALDGWEAPPVSLDFNRRLYRRIESGAALSWWERITNPFRSMPLRQVLPLSAMAGLVMAAGFLVERPANVAPVSARGEIVRASQVERTLDDLDLLGQFGAAESAESAHPDAM